MHKLRSRIGLGKTLEITTAVIYANENGVEKVIASFQYPLRRETLITIDTANHISDRARMRGGGRFWHKTARFDRAVPTATG